MSTLESLPLPLLLGLGLLGIFASIGIALTIIGVTTQERRAVGRSMAALEALTSAPTEMRKEVELPFSERVLEPALAKFSRLSKRLAPNEGAERIQHRLDIAGNPGLRRLRRAMTPAGTAVIVGGEDGGDLTGGMNRTLRALVLSVVSKQRFANFINKERASDLERLTGLIDAGQVTPSLDRTYPLDQVPEAMRQLEAGEVRGKVAITVLPGGDPADG